MRVLALLVWFVSLQAGPGVAQHSGWKVAWHQNARLHDKPANPTDPLLGVRPEGYRMPLNKTFYTNSNQGLLKTEGEPLQHDIQFAYTHTRHVAGWRV